MFEDKGFLERPLIMMATLILGSVALLVSNLAGAWEISFLRGLFLFSLMGLFPLGAFSLVLDLRLKAAREQLQEKCLKDEIPFDEKKVRLYGLREGALAAIIAMIFFAYPLAVSHYVSGSESARIQYEMARLIREAEKQLTERGPTEARELLTRVRFCEEMEAWTKRGSAISWLKEFQKSEGFDCMAVLAGRDKVVPAAAR
jgi:hypothetical protein